MESLGELATALRALIARVEALEAAARPEETPADQDQDQEVSG